MSEPKVIKVSKLDAARRQLDGAIQLWFSEGDPVAIHTLVCAAHQIIEDRNKKREDTSLHVEEIARKTVKPEYLEGVISQIRKPMTFFKHANRDPYDVLDFNPDFSVMLMILAINGLKLLGEQISDFQRVFFFWLSIHETDLHNPLKDLLSADQVDQFRLVEKREFLKRCLLAIAATRTRG